MYNYENKSVNNKQTTLVMSVSQQFDNRGISNIQIFNRK